ncbi:hypothetical protein BKA67DRAFT_529227 [Truncatella angustata]|uniref:Uncharacterized protein n=1 Tax=Truncatella angustata TaxID=152316 RepID=A0A9P8UVA7_9PEZI|nr:uncharacterized protein BKA67DRAFT_529227 [Truncatella angustata]KAH6659038.1 hypothetical protein BKA67DRAFT_529227 [Truncatella angustata]
MASEGWSVGLVWVGGKQGNEPGRPGKPGSWEPNCCPAPSTQHPAIQGSRIFAPSALYIVIDLSPSNMSLFHFLTVDCPVDRENNSWLAWQGARPGTSHVHEKSLSLALLALDLLFVSAMVILAYTSLLRFWLSSARLPLLN